MPFMLFIRKESPFIPRRKTMALKTKCIKAEKLAKDELRISVMSRHTLSDGITHDSDITKESFDEWWQDLSPGPVLVGSYYKGKLSWEAFAEKFNEYLQMSKVQKRLAELNAISCKRDVTILCVEISPEFCHRRLIAEACKKLEPSLDIIIE